ncbi:MAG: ATP-binding protein [Bacteroidota bacterium]
MTFFKNISIKSKLILIQVATGMVAVLICCIIFVYNDITTFKNSLISNKYSIAEIVGENSIAPLVFNDKDAANKILLHFNDNTSILNAVILDKRGKEFARYNKKGEETFPFVIPNGTASVIRKFFEQKFIVSYQIFQKKVFIGTVILRAEITNLNTIIYNYIKIAILVLIVGVLSAFIISTFFQRLITKRLLSLVATTKEVIETGNYSIRCSLNGTDEIKALSEGFNNMLGQIEKNERTLKENNIDLERRVKERTLELETVNKVLLIKSEELIGSNKELEQFAYVASHDLQEPLRTINNYVGLLVKTYSGKKNEDTELYFTFILTATSKMQNLIKDLLDFSRVGRNMSFAAVDCNKILKEAIADLDLSIKESNAKITSAILPVLSGNETELKRLFLNLISNAIKFHKKNGIPEIAITVEAKDTEYLFAIKDNGIGIEEQYIPKLFIIFQRLHKVEEYPGTGIGLATCKKIVTLHNGKIWLESKLGEGSTFYFTLPKGNNLKHNGTHATAI